jgi:anti-sigma factor RsiW
MRVTNYPAGWTCDLIVVRIERYLAGGLPRAEALAVAEHIEACVWCSERIAMLLLLGETSDASEHRPGPRRAPSGGAATQRRRGKRKRGNDGR